MGILGSGEIRTGWGAADVIVGAAGLVLSLGAFAGIHWVRRRFVLPLERVAAAIGRMRDGGTGTRIEGEGLLPVEREFNEMARRIDGKLFELKRVDDLKTEFISTVSHELRTPLTSIAGYTQLLSQGDAGPVNETQREFLEIVDTNVRRLSELINDLLDIEKIQAGKIHLARERVDLGGVLAECVDTFRLLASRKGLALELRVAAREPFVIGDRARLVQIFMNLLSNAVKYTDRGRIEVVAEERDFALSVEIRDSGIGISAEEREGLFEKFYRTKSAALSRQGGTGLGLAVTRALVEGHQGKIRVESEPGKGSVFAVRLPFAGAITAPANG
ncbi:MAG: HAMP domain-containing histidine kinase, partial [Oligoflexia bacterium]|nr:HAMP domain-containing histidine kinase [Oligoflexia bacterium]